MQKNTFFKGWILYIIFTGFFFQSFAANNGNFTANKANFGKNNAKKNPTQSSKVYIRGSVNIGKDKYSTGSRSNTEKTQNIFNLIAKNSISIKEAQEKINYGIPSTIKVKQGQIADNEKIIQNFANLIPTISNLEYVSQLTNAINSLTTSNNNINQEIADLEYQQNYVLPQTIKDLQAQTAEYNALSTQLTNIQNSATDTNITTSFGGGYQFTIQEISLGVGAEFDVGITEIGSNMVNEINAKSNFAFSILGQAGYQFMPKYKGYVTVGLKWQSFKLSYSAGNFSYLQNSQVQSFIMGVGIERQINNNFAAFVEINNINAINSPKFNLTTQELKFNSMQLKIGAKYYIDTKELNNLFRR